MSLALCALALVAATPAAATDVSFDTAPTLSAHTSAGAPGDRVEIVWTWSDPDPFSRVMLLTVSFEGGRDEVEPFHRTCSGLAAPAGGHGELRTFPTFDRPGTYEATGVVVTRSEACPELRLGPERASEPATVRVVVA